MISPSPIVLIPMTAFTPDAAASLPGREADRRRAAARLAETPLPTAQAEEWRYSPIDDLDLTRFQPALRAGPLPGQAVDDVLAAHPDRAATVVVVDGFVTSCDVDPGWAGKGLAVDIDEGAGAGLGLRGDPGSALDELHDAFCPSPVQVRVRAGAAIEAPVVVVQVHTGNGGVSSPHLVVDAGADAEVTVVEHRTSVGGDGLALPLVELRAGPAARLRYVEVQDLGPELWQLGRQVSSVDAQASLVAGTAAFGGAYARVRFDCDLVGRGASGQLLAAYYGDGDQVLDFRTFQHHRAPDTTSDLVFKGALDDGSGSIYSGLIRIHPDGGGSNAFQTNRNVKLSDDAWAWSVPNLEIENNDVRCSHASTVSPVDEEQQFYLHSRGVPPAVADRLIVAGFFDEVLRRLPSASVRDLARTRIAGKLEARYAR
jgi:Fe-S cluster assembly protein SufD